MKKILFLISDQIYIRNYVENNLLKKIEKKFKIEILLNSNIKNKKNLTKLKNYNITFFKTSKFGKFIIHYQNLKITNFKNKSSFFPFRLKRLYRFDKRYLYELNEGNFDENNSKIGAKLRNILGYRILIKNFIKYFFFKILSLTPFFLIIKFVKDNLPLNQNFSDILKKVKPDLLLIPTSGYDVDCLQMLDVSKRLKIKNYIIVDNWDNLSSKVLFDNLPDRVGVWGEQTKKHAINIQNIKSSNISILGSSRAEIFFEKRHSKQKSLYSDYIIFLGSSWAWDEEGTINKIDHLIENINKNLNRAIKLVYRPHPYRQKKTVLNKDWKHTILDFQLKTHFDSTNKNMRNWPNLNYYPSLIKNCDFIIGGLTSMLIESTIFWKKYLAIAYDDGKSLMNQQSALKLFPHLKGIERMSNIIICKNEKKLENEFLKFFMNPKNNKLDKENKKKIDISREYFLKGNNTTFSKNLLNDIDHFF